MNSHSCSGTPAGEALTVETIVYSARDVTNSVSITQTASVHFQPVNEAAGSTVVATSTTPTVSNVGGGGTTITVTLQQGASCPPTCTPIAGASVSLTAGSGSSVITTSPATTNASGVATFTVTDTSAQSVTYTAKDQTNLVTITQTATVNFQPGPSSASLSTVSASPAGVPADGSTPSTITVTLKDKYSNPEPAGISVSLTAGSGSSVITTSPATTNASGVATFTVTDNTVETIVYSARDVTNSVSITQTASVHFQPVDEALDSTVVTSNSSPPTSSGSLGAVITVTLEQGTGCMPTCTPVVGANVSLGASGGSSIIVCNSSPCQTNALGQVGFTVSDRFAETIIYSAEDTSNLVTVNQTVSLAFVFSGGSSGGGSQGGAQAGVSAGLSTISVNSSRVSADGVSGATVTVHLVSTQGSSVPGKSVSLTTTVTGSNFAGMVTPQSMITDSNGDAIFTITDSTIQQVIISADDVSDSIQLASSVTVDFVTPIASAELSLIEATPTQVPADGVSSSTIIVTLRDSGNLVSKGLTVSLTGSVNGGVFHGTISPQSAVTDSQGSAIFTITDGTAENVVITASDVTDSITLDQTASIDFTEATVAPNSSFITVSPTNLAVGKSATVDVWIEDANQGPIQGKTVTLSGMVSGGTFHGTISPPSSVTTSNGNAVFQITDAVPETVILSGRDLTDGIEVQLGATVTFQGSSPPSSGQTPPPSSSKPNGFEMVTAFGWVGNFGQTQGYGSASGLSSFVVGAATTPNGQGYWLATANGSVEAFGNAGLYGSADSLALAKPIVGMSSTPDGQGYWLVASDGGIFAFGDASFYGSTGNLVLAKPIVGMSSTPDGQGYWLVASDGGIFAFGDAVEMGSLGGKNIGQQVAGMAVTSDGHGYWIVTQGGEIFSFGDAPDVGSGYPFGPVSVVVSG